MDARNESESSGHALNVERTSDCDLVVTHTVNAPAHLVFQAWTRPELFKRWWAPKSCGLTILAVEMDARTGGTYRLEMGHPSFDQPMAFFGNYLEVIPNERLVWTNDEGGEGGAVTTVTFEEKAGVTLVVVHERYPSKEALEEAVASGSTSGWGEQFGQLAGLLQEMHPAA